MSERIMNQPCGCHQSTNGFGQTEFRYCDQHAARGVVPFVNVTWGEVKHLRQLEAAARQWKAARDTFKAYRNAENADAYEAGENALDALLAASPEAT